MRTIYKEIITSKTGFKIPLLQNGRTIESRYNPEIDVERKIESIKKDDLFYLVIGLASGLLVSKLLEKNENAAFLVVENSSEDIEFLKSLPESKKIIDLACGFSNSNFNDNSSRVKLCTKDNLEKTLSAFYIPSLHGNLNIIEQTNYISDDLETASIKEKINSALKNIMADFSVQAHFGKLWQRNIMINLSKQKSGCALNLPTKKTAVILAAGPSLDFYFEKLISTREKYYIIATDTAYSVCIGRGLKADAVVSIDGQYVSENHFLHKIDDNTLFVFDLCANNSAVKKAIKKSSNVIFTNTGHPLSQFACKKNPASFVNLFSGSGTVTITAVDFALKAGFSKIEIAGADFSYTNGKPYAKGTYLDNLYSKNSNRIFPSEMTFARLMYRTELTKLNEKTFSTPVLASYKKSLEEYLFSSNVKFKNENNVYYIENENAQNKFLKNNISQFFYIDFYKSISDSYGELDLSKINYTSLSEISPLIISVLPYIAHLRLSNQNFELQGLLKLALKNLLRYNKYYEKK